jgi:L-2-hydroxyglutarate oxidase LhgO
MSTLSTEQSGNETMETISVDAVVFGGGIVGLCLALKYKEKNPEAEVVVLEKTHFLGDQSTGRNSGVLHAGIYYKNNSLKHSLCMNGYQQWRDLSEKLNIRTRICGKFIFSVNANQDQELEDVFQVATKNGVTIRHATSAQIKELENQLHISNALYSPNTGIIDTGDAVNKISSLLEMKGVHIIKDFDFKNLERLNAGFEIESNYYKIKTEVLFNCAGLGSLELRGHLGLQDMELYRVKGNYISTSQKLEYTRLFYPVPPKDLKGLGVHSTIDINGAVKFGPNTEDVETVDYSPSLIALKEMTPVINSYFKNVDNDKLYWDYAGVRTKIRTNDKQAYTDFWIKKPIEGYIECLGIESPGLTSAPAIADYCLRLL